MWQSWGRASLSLPAYLAAIQQRSRQRALTQLRCGSHWLAEETGRWVRLQRNDRMCPHFRTEGAFHLEDVAHAILHCPRGAALRGQFAELFTGRLASSLAALFVVICIYAYLLHNGPLFPSIACFSNEHCAGTVHPGKNERLFPMTGDCFQWVVKLHI